MRKMGKIPIFPEDKRYNHEVYRKYLHNQVRSIAGLPMKKGEKLEVHGWLLKDNRANPPLLIWKNCSIKMQVGFKPLLPEPPIPFAYLEEALAYKAKMNLSMDDNAKIKAVALCPEPDLGSPVLDTIWMSKKDIKNR